MVIMTVITTERFYGVALFATNFAHMIYSIIMWISQGIGGHNRILCLIVSATYKCR